MTYCCNNISILFISILFSILFLFSFFCIEHCSLICTKTFHLCLYFFLFVFFLCVLNSIYGFNHCDLLNSNTRRIFLVLILVLSEVSSFHNEAHNFPYQKSQALILPIGILYKSTIFN